MKKEYRSLFRIRFINSLQYRVAAFAGMLSQIGWALMELFAFAAFYRTDSTAFPMELSQTVSYIWLQEAFIVLISGFMIGDEIPASIETGSVAYDLVRPMDLYERWICQFIAKHVAGVMLRCIPILILAFVVPIPYRMSLPPDIETFALFLLSMVLAVGVVAAFSMLIYISVFYTLSFNGTRLVFTSLSMFLSGAIVPLPFFPASVRTIVELLPFASMQNMPFRIYSGNIVGFEILGGIILQVFWLIVLVIIGRYGLQRALKRVLVQGG